MCKRIICCECNAEITGVIKVRDIAFTKGSYYPVVGSVKINPKTNVPDFTSLKENLARRQGCSVTDIKLSLCEYFKIPGEALLVTKYGVESCGFICPDCNTTNLNE